DLDSALVEKHTAYFAARPEYLQRVFDRSRLYLYHIVEEIEKRGLPTELALLPMVESAFNPMAYSRAHASGLWQFIPGTGRRFELKQNWWYDGRRDIVDSTTAALDYLTRLYELHGDWQLALNPGFSRPLIRAALTPRIVLPADKVDVFHANLIKHDENALVSWQSYQTKRGETLESIAKKFGLTLGQLKEVNGIAPRRREV